MSRDYAKVLPRFWTGDTGRAIRRRSGSDEADHDSRDRLLVALYLQTCPSANMIGLYYLPIATLSHETGIPFEGASKALRRLSEEGFAHYDPEREEVWVPNMARIQIGESLKPGDNQIKSVERLASEYKKSRFFGNFVDAYANPYHLSSALRERGGLPPFEGPSKALRSQEQEQEKEQKQEQEHDHALARVGMTDQEVALSKAWPNSGLRGTLGTGHTAELAAELVLRGLDPLLACQKWRELIGAMSKRGVVTKQVPAKMLEHLRAGLIDQLINGEITVEAIANGGRSTAPSRPLRLEPPRYADSRDVDAELERSRERLNREREERDRRAAGGSK